MTDNISQMIRWNTKFVRGLAQSVLERAKVIRSGLTSYYADQAESMISPASKSKKRGTGKKASAQSLSKAAASSRRKSRRRKSRRG